MINLYAEKIARALLLSRRTVAMTGAGISRASGIHGFNDPLGPWKNYDASKMTLKYFRENPNYLWEMLGEFLVERLYAEPNPAHQALADLERMGLLHAIITQNIDGLHQKAGSKNVLEFYGGVNHCYCLDCGSNVAITPSFINKWFFEKEEHPVPRCQICGGILIPDIPLYDTPLSTENVFAAEQLALSANLMMIIGTALKFGPIGLLPNVTRRHGGVVMIINHSETTFDDRANIICRANLQNLLPAIAADAEKQRAITMC